ncbi:hypothetical protein ABK040_001171 [Willaertia magna]
MNTELSFFSLNIEGKTSLKEEDYIKQKVQHLKDLISKLDTDFVFLQECSDAYYTKLLDIDNYEAIRQREYVILYKPTTETLSMEKVSGKEESNLKPFGLMAKFQIQMRSDNKVQTTIKIATGRWEPFKQGKPTRIKQFKQLSEEQGPVVFAGDTNLRKGEIRFKNDSNLVDVYNYLNEQQQLLNAKKKLKLTPIDEYTVDVFANEYFKGGHPYHSRYDRAFISNGAVQDDYNNNVTLEPLALRIEAKEKYNDLIREERPSGCLSDHYGLYFRIKVQTERDSSDSESDN